MVEIFMEVIGKLRDDVNDFLRKDNGSLYLKMAYEEDLLLVALIGKKKFYGILHIREPNFNNELFIRGVEIVKQGQFKYFRKMDKVIMKKSIRLDNIHTMHQIVENELQETVNNITQVDPSELVQTYGPFAIERRETTEKIKVIFICQI